jgi:LmbE family N-acetylglucosaminyl deacetylase
VGQNGSILVSHDAGQNWYPAGTFVDTDTRELLDFTRVCLVTPRVGYVVGELGTRLMMTEDAGRSWTLRPTDNNDWLRSVWANPHGKVVAAGAREKILISNNGGFKWTTVRGDNPKTDLLVMLAHGDDAAIELGAVYAHYAINEGKNIVDIEVLRDAHSVEYRGEIYNLEHHRDIRMSGVRTTTYFDEFENGNNGCDYYHFTERLWEGEENVVRHMVAAIRAYRPDVVIIHGGVFGDYDKPGHKLSGRAGIPAFETSGGEIDHWPELTRLGLGPWQAKKLYALASESYPVTLDLAPIGEMPLQGTKGTCLDWAEYVIRNFQSQGVYHAESGKLSLIKSLVSVPNIEKSVFDGLE